jgi:hypothetical protein
VEERLQKLIASISGWPEFKELEINVKSKRALTEEVQRALRATFHASFGSIYPITLPLALKVGAPHNAVVARTERS